MARSAREHVFDGMELLLEPLIPFVERRLESNLSGHWQARVKEKRSQLEVDGNGHFKWDRAALFNVMDRFWAEAFSDVLGKAERSLVNELSDIRNRHAHDNPFSYDDAERALDSMRRLMQAIGSGEVADRLGTMRDTILRTKFNEQRRNEERRKTPRPTTAVGVKPGLPPWREVVTPHADVSSGDYQQAEFAADLAKVYSGSASGEYTDPKAFFSRTSLTDGLARLLERAAKRLSGVAGGDPVVELQTNFGGGKTHSMLALYHMAGTKPADDLPGLDQLLKRADVSVPGRIARAVLVGTSRGPLEVLECKDGRKVRTIWGELADQLGGADAFAMVAEQDEKGIAPGSNLLESLLRKYAPCLILIDEWVAYLRQIYRQEGLPSGSFDANLTFVQNLTEAVKAAPQALLVASLPASKAEVGGDGGEEALRRLKQTFGRIESSWRPASQEESYEIVRRRLFEEIPGDRWPQRDHTVQEFARLYRENRDDFPRDCAEQDYRRKLEIAYPIHPDLFDHLYTTWSTVENFQLTRGVLRLMAQVVYELWRSGDPSAMIMPGSVILEAGRVESELLRYLPDTWQGIIAGDVDGPDATPVRIGREAPNLERHWAPRRVARAVFMATAPATDDQPNRGIDDKRISLGVVQPGEKPSLFSDALRRLANQAQYLHGEAGRYWYATSPSLNRTARDRANGQEEERVLLEVDKALRDYINDQARGDRGAFDAVHPAPSDSADVPDEANGIHLVVFGVDHPHRRNGARNGGKRHDGAALRTAGEMFLKRGEAPRLYCNTLVFLAADERQLEGVKQGMRDLLAWNSICADGESGRLDLKKSDTVLARQKATEAAETVRMRIRETWCYLIAPHQPEATSDVDFPVHRVSTQDGLLKRISKKLQIDGTLLPEIGAETLNGHLERHNIWQDKPHLALRDLCEYVDRYAYLPRLKNRAVLLEAVRAAVGGILPGPFAYAARWDEQANTYVGLVTEQVAATGAPTVHDDGVIVRADVAIAHRPPPTEPEPGAAEPDGGNGKGGLTEPDVIPAPVREKRPTRFVGTVMISQQRPVDELLQVVEEVVEHLTTLPDCKVELKLEIDAEVPSGLDPARARTITENATTLDFIDNKLSSPDER